MAVDIYASNVLGSGQGPVTFFADDFNRAGADLGNNWIRVREFPTPFNNPWGFPDSFLTGTAMAINGSGINNPLYQIQGYVIALPTRNGTRGATQQFAQATCVSRSGPQGQMGLCVQINDDSNNCYSGFLDFGGGPFNINIGRTNGGTFLGLAGGGAFGTLAPGDILRISADVIPASTTLRVSKNGSVVGTFVDNGGSRLSAGYTGGFYTFRQAIVGGVADLSTWDNFSCGIGL